MYDEMLEIQEINGRLQMMLDASPLGISYFDSNHKLIHCNQEIVNMLGLIDKADYQQNFFQFMPPYQPDNRPSQYTFKRLLRDTFLHRKVSQEFIFQHYNGTILPTDNTFVRLRRNGEYVVVNYTRDMTARYRAREREQEAINTINLMLDAMPLACFLVRLDFTAIDCNKAAVELFGFNNKEDALARYLDIFPEPPMSGSLARVLKSGGHANFDYVHIDVENNHVHCNVTLEIMNYRGEQVVAAYYQDIRHIREMYGKVESSVQSARDESRAKNQFLARMSHEIRTPVGIIKGISDIQLHKGYHPPETEEAFLQIQNSSELLSNIINDILDLSKVAAGKMEIVNKPYETVSMILDTVQLNILHRGSKKIDFLLEVDELLPLYFVGDEIRIKQILNNLLSNAFKYTREGHIVLHFEVSNHKGKTYFNFSVSDTGQGMTKEQISSLFNVEYIRFNEEENRYTEGIGLGMSITFELLRLMGGEITVDSDKGKGTWFHIRLPQELSGDQIIGNEIAENLRNFEQSQPTLRRKGNFLYEPMPYGKVLVVDDQDTNLYVAKGLLQPYDLAVDTATSGKEALEKIESGVSYDIIFMDHMMPEMDGIETAKRIMDAGYNLPIVAMTANAILGQSELFMNRGFAGFISKPIDMNNLNTILLRLIRDKYPDDVVENAKTTPANESTFDYSLPDNIVEAFVRDAKRALEFLELFMEVEWTPEMLENYTVVTHGLKGVFRNISEQSLAKSAALLEEAGRKEDIQFIKEHTRYFMDSLIDLIVTNSPDNPEQADEDVVFLKEMLRQFSLDSENYNKKGAKKVLNILNQKAWSKETRTSLSELSALLLHSEFEKASEYANEVLKSFESD